MKPPFIPSDDAERLKVLRSYGVLDTEAEGPYDQTGREEVMPVFEVRRTGG